ncbi:flavin reductase family protein [Campylobacterota bacterium]
MFNTSLQLDEQCHAQPRPTALLTCGSNIMPLSWHMPVSKSPFRYAIAVREENHSHQLLKENREFALNFLDLSYQHVFETSGGIHGKNVDKFELCGLSSKQALTIGTSLIQEAYMIYECTLIDIISYGDHDLFIGDVNIILNKDTKTVEPTLFLGKGYYDTLTGNPIRMQRSKNE